ncbi:hypothetical protein AMK15_27895 [Streptomyces sp. MJM1172]|nr:hypothetical protein AMK15_27895 [Streptomyces sp. MJM1172]
MFQRGLQADGVGAACEMGGESTGEESGREPAEHGEGRARRRWTPGRRLAGRVAVPLEVEAVRAVVLSWAPEWSDVAPVLEVAVQLALRFRHGADAHVARACPADHVGGDRR